MLRCTGVFAEEGPSRAYNHLIRTGSLPNGPLQKLAKICRHFVHLCVNLFLCVVLFAAKMCGRKRVTDPREPPFAVIFLKTPAMAATQLGLTHARARETSETIVVIATSLFFNVHMLWNLSNLL